MAEADITIVRNVSKELFRLIITSHDGRTVVSQERTLKYIIRHLWLMNDPDPQLRLTS